MSADEYLETLEGKIRKCLFFYVKLFQNNSVNGFLFIQQKLPFLLWHCRFVLCKSQRFLAKLSIESEIKF